MTEIVLNTVSGQEWDRFVKAHPASSLCHLHGWLDVAARAYGHAPFALAATEGGKVVGVLPAVLMTSRLFGRSLVSMPFLDEGGPLAESPEISAALLSELAGVAGKRSASVDLRCGYPLDVTEMARVGDKVSMWMKLAEEEEKLLKTLPATRRNRIRKANGNGLVAVFAGPERLGDFYRVFCRNMRDLGSPVHSLRFFTEILASFPENSGLVLVEDESGKVLGAGLYFRHGDTMALPWVSSIRDDFGRYPNITLYWELMRRASGQGCRAFDFGRSSVGSGTYEFKRQWGAEPRELFWYAPHSGAGAGLEADLRANSSKKEMAMKVWSRLPLPIANFAGPLLRRSISL